MTHALKIAFYQAARACGLFAIARFLTRRRLRILGYHGFASGDEVEFRPKLFISPATFKRRLELLAQRGFSVIRLDDAVRQLRRGRLAEDAVVITIDDGYASTLAVAPLLADRGFPATVYLTTYHVQKQTPVFDLVVGYMLWKAGSRQLSLAWPPGGAGETLYIDAANAVPRLLELGHTAVDEEARVQLCRILGEATGVSYDQVLEQDTFRLLSADDIRGLSRHGISVGLHTHRHRFPVNDLECCRRELADNEAVLASLAPLDGRHFCYPSGVYSRVQWSLLEELGIGSSTTCDTGLVRAGDPPHGLKRFLDGEMVSEVEFDAEICGFAELLRGFLGIRRDAAPSA